MRVTRRWWRGWAPWQDGCYSATGVRQGTSSGLKSVDRALAPGHEALGRVLRFSNRSYVRDTGQGSVVIIVLPILSVTFLVTFLRISGCGERYLQAPDKSVHFLGR